MPTVFAGSRRHFPSLSSCLDHLTARYPAGVPATPTAGTAPPIVRFLFRGEPGLFPTTLPRAVRPGCAGAELRDVWIDLEGDFFQTFEDTLGTRTTAFLHHYGVPTDYVEFTSSPWVAAHFATRDAGADCGLIGVLDTEIAARSCEIVTLCGQPGAIRPERQQCHAVRHRRCNLTDYKDPALDAEIGLRWYAFEISADEPAVRRAGRAWRSAGATHRDRFARWVRQQLLGRQHPLGATAPAATQVLRHLEHTPLLGDRAPCPPRCREPERAA